MIVIDVHRTDSAQLADWFIQLKKGSDFEVVWALRYLLHDGDLTNDQIGLANKAINVPKSTSMGYPFVDIRFLQFRALDEAKKISDGTLVLPVKPLIKGFNLLA